MTTKRFAPLLHLAVLLCAVLLANLRPLIAAAAPATTGTPSTESGLLITPIRQFLSVDSGKTLKSNLTVANLTDSSLSVTLSVKQFSVTDYVYNYTFSQPTNDWLHLAQTDITLQPHHTAVVAYDVAVPPKSPPGGRYYTLFASANLSSQGINSTIQAADLLYLTVGGKLMRTSHLQHSSMPWVSFGRSIPFNLQAVNTGNVYFFAYVTGELQGLFTHQLAATATHLLMPDKARALNGSITSPMLPGIYKATIGYKTDSGQHVSRSRLILFIPPWFVAVILGALLLAGKFLPDRKSKKSAPGSSDQEN